MANTYDAFISYSHAADGKLAPALQNALQRFAKPWYRRRALHLFRDQTSLSATPGLWPAIEQALTRSRYFLLLASPEAADSRWVQQEVQWWLEHKSPQTLLIALTDGKIAREEGAKDFDWETTDALPPNLKGVFVETPLWVDFRWAKGAESFSTKNPEFQNALAALAAPLRDLPKEDLIGEDVRQHRRALLLARGAAAVLVVLFAAAVASAVFAFQQRDKATEAAVVSQIRALSAQARLQRNLDQDERGALLAAEAYAASMRNGGMQRGVAAAALRDTVDVPYFSRLLDTDQDGMYSLAFSRNGEMLAAGSFDGTVQLWNMVSSPPSPVGEPFPATNGNEVVETLEFSASGSFLVTGGFEGDLKWWDLRGLEIPGEDQPPRLTHGEIPRASRGEVREIAFSPRGDYMAAAGDNGFLQVWGVNESSETPFTELPPLCRPVPGVPQSPAQCLQTGSVRSLAFNHDGSLLAAGGDEGVVWVWDVHGSPTPRHEFGQDGNAVWAIAFHPTRDLVATGGDTSLIALWDLSVANGPCAVLRGHDERVRSVAFTPDGETLVSGSQDETVRLWDVEPLPMGEECETRRGAADVNPLAVLGGSEEWVRAVAVSPQGATLASTSAGGKVRLWDLGELGTERKILSGHTNWVTSLAFGPGEVGENGAAPPVLASGSTDGTVRLWRPGEGLAFRLPDGKPVKAVAITPPGSWLAAAGNGGAVYMWNLDDVSDPVDPAVPAALPMGSERPGMIFALAFSPDGTRLAAAARNGTFLVWDINLDDPSRTPPPRGFGQAVAEDEFDDRIECSPNLSPLLNPQMWSVAFSPDNRTIAAGDSNGVIHVVDLDAEGAPSILELEGHAGGIGSLAFSRDGAWLASASCDTTVRLWASGVSGFAEAQQSGSARVLRGHDEAVLAVGFSADGRLLASGSQDQTIRLWELDQPEDDPGVLGGREEWVRAVAFSPDGKTLAASSADATIRLWTVQATDLFERVCMTVGRELTEDERIQYLGQDQPYQPTCRQPIVP